MVMVAINIKAMGMFIWTSWYWPWVSSLVKVGKNLTFYFYNRIWLVRILWLIEFSDHACNIFTKKFNCDSHMLDVCLAPFSVSSCNKFKHKWPLVLRMTRHQSVNLPLDLQGHHYWLLKQLLEKQALPWGEPCSINPTLPHLYNYSIIKQNKKKNGKFLSFVGSSLVTSPRILLINGYLDFMN